MGVSWFSEAVGDLLPLLDVEDGDELWVERYEEPEERPVFSLYLAQ